MQVIEGKNGKVQGKEGKDQGMEEKNKKWGSSDILIVAPDIKNLRSLLLFPGIIIVIGVY